MSTESIEMKELLDRSRRIVSEVGLQDTIMQERERRYFSGT
jgi:hypothetical protein